MLWKRSSTVMVVPSTPAHGCGAADASPPRAPGAGMSTPSACAPCARSVAALRKHGEAATCEIEARAWQRTRGVNKASARSCWLRNAHLPTEAIRRDVLQLSDRSCRVEREERGSGVRGERGRKRGTHESERQSLEVAKRSHSSEKSARRMPLPVSLTCRSLSPPPPMVTVIEVAPASSEFSSSSLTAFAGRWTTSPAAIRLTTSSGSLVIASSGWRRLHHGLSMNPAAHP